MRQSPPTYHLHDTDQIECRHQLSPLETAGYPVLEISPKDRPSGRIEIYPTMGRLRRLHAVIGAYLAAHDDHEDVPGLPGHPRPRGRWPVPAEACCGPTVDADDLFASAMAASFEPLREPCDDPTAAEIAAGVRDAPGGVP